MIIRYVEIMATNCGNESKYDNVVKKLGKIIERIEYETKLQFVSSCFLGEVDVAIPGEGSYKIFAIGHEAMQKFLLFFR